MNSSKVIARSLGSAVVVAPGELWSSRPQSKGAARAWYLTLHTNNISSECVLSAWGLGTGICFFLGAVAWVSGFEQTWSLFGVLPSYWSVHAWNWKEAAFLSSVSR